MVISIRALGSGFGFGGGAGVPAFALSSCCFFFLLPKREPRLLTTASEPLVGMELPESVDLELSFEDVFEEVCDVFGSVPGCGGIPMLM